MREGGGGFGCCVDRMNVFEDLVLGLRWTGWELIGYRCVGLVRWWCGVGKKGTKRASVGGIIGPLDRSSNSNQSKILDDLLLSYYRCKYK
jgi:hypothetical protein